MWFLILSPGFLKFYSKNLISVFALYYLSSEECFKFFIILHSFFCTCSFFLGFIIIYKRQFFFKSPSVVFQSLSHVRLFVTHGLQYARLLCPSPSPGAYLKSCPLSRWHHPTITSSVVLFSSCLQSCPASWCFPMCRLFA